MSDAPPTDAFGAMSRDAAGRSLADALALSFRVLRVLFVLLLVAFVFSGVFTVDQNQVAVRTSFGRVTGGGVLTSEGGPYFRWPRPIGEVYFIPTTDRSVRIDRSFAFSSRNLNESLATAEPLPDQTDTNFGFLLTGDGNIVYARYDVRYRVRPEQALDFLRRVGGPELTRTAAADPEAVARPSDVADYSRVGSNPEALFQRADRFVRVAVEQAAVADAASRGVDDFRLGRAAQATPEAGADPALPPVAGAADVQSSVAARAQALLDTLNLGLEITSVQRPEVTVPPGVRRVFDELNQALQLRAALVQQGRADRRAILTAAAGEAAGALLAVIEAYEAADARVRAGDASAGVDLDASRDAIDALLAGAPAGDVLAALAAALPERDPFAERLLDEAQLAPGATVSGEAFATVSRADSEASALSRQAESLRLRAEALSPEYQADPERVRRRLMLAVVRDVLSRPDVEVEYVPDAERLVVPIAPDPQRREQDDRRRLDAARR